MNSDKKLVELKEFKRNKREVFVDFKSNIVRWKNNIYHLKLVNVGGTTYKYVEVKNIKPLSEINGLINQINNKRNKSYLKNTEYEVYDKNYLVIGIGYEAIKVYINGNNRPEFLKYNTQEGQRLLFALANNLQSRLIIEEE